MQKNNKSSPITGLIIWKTLDDFVAILHWEFLSK
jgi:hypothetical protein